MSENNTITVSNPFANVLCFISAVITAMIGYTIHSSIFWCIMNFIFWPFSIVKWLVCRELTLEVIKNTFDWFC